MDSDNINNNKHTITGNVVIIDNYYMPEFDRFRSLRIYLPKDYYANSKHYPVLYMHDGQNLFDEATSYSGEWCIDETLENYFDEKIDSGSIIVGIDNGGEHRISEYTPWKNIKHGGGAGDLYGNFIINTLKPYIDKNYRTLKDRCNTGIGGSSLGGLISFYIALKHQDIFGQVTAFSSSFWYNRDELWRFLDSCAKEYNMKIYIDAGYKEDMDDPEYMARDAEAVYHRLLSMGFLKEELKLILDKEGMHNEASWRRRFPYAYLWLKNIS